MRITKKVFNDLGLWMMAFGLSIGLVFPFFVTFLGVPKNYTLTKTFFIACVSAGLLAGFINYFLAKKVVGGRLQSLSDVGLHMRHLAESMRGIGNDVEDIELNSDGDICGEQGCYIDVDSDDEFGESAQSFNLLAETLNRTITTERAARAFTNMLATQLDLDPLSQKAIQKIISYTGSSAGLLAVVDKGELRNTAHFGLSSQDEIIQSTFVKEAVKSNRPQFIEIPDTQNFIVDHLVGQHQAKYVLVYPVLYKSVSLGVIVLTSAKTYDSEIISRLELLSVGLGLALNNSITHGRMRVLATLDPLTEIYNRGFGVKRLHEEYRRSVRSDSPLGVIIFDVDDFKAINDTYGHLAGDRVLVNIVRTAKRMLREGDLLIRYGGEEFMAVLPGASIADVEQVGERIRRAVQDMAIMEGEELIKLTVSLGGVSHPELNVEHEEALIRRADLLLYQAKESGKNKIEVDQCGVR